MKKVFLLVVGLLLAGGPAWAASWGRNGLWNDGRAEVAFYDAERIVDGKVRKFQEQLIIQKTDRVFKMNQVLKFDGDNTPYSYLTSVFVEADDLRKVVKLTVGSQDWVGNTFKFYRDGELSWNSYLDGEADQTLKLELTDNDYFEDQLPLSLRGWDFKKVKEAKIRVWDSFVTNHGTAPVVQAVTVKVEGEETVRGRFGSLVCWKLVLTYPNGNDTYWLEKAEPNLLIKMETRDGRKRSLYGRARWSYWDKRLPKPNVLK